MICQEGLTQKGFFFSPGCTTYSTRLNQGRITVPDATEPLVQEGVFRGAVRPMPVCSPGPRHRSAGVDALGGMHKVALRDFLPGWCLGAADLQSVGTAWMEVTARGRIGGVCYLSLKDDALRPPARIGLRHGGGGSAAV